MIESENNAVWLSAVGEPAAEDKVTD